MDLRVAAPLPPEDEIEPRGIRAVVIEQSNRAERTANPTPSKSRLVDRPGKPWRSGQDLTRSLRSLSQVRDLLDFDGSRLFCGSCGKLAPRAGLEPATRCLEDGEEPEE